MDSIDYIEKKVSTPFTNPDAEYILNLDTEIVYDGLKSKCNIPACWFPLWQKLLANPYTDESADRIRYIDIFSWCIVCLTMIKVASIKITKTSYAIKKSYIFQSLVNGMFLPNCGMTVKTNPVDNSTPPKMINMSYCERIIRGLIWLSRITPKDRQLQSPISGEDWCSLFKNIIFESPPKKWDEHLTALCDINPVAGSITYLETLQESLSQLQKPDTPAQAKAAAEAKAAPEDGDNFNKLRHYSRKYKFTVKADKPYNLIELDIIYGESTVVNVEHGTEVILGTHKSFTEAEKSENYDTYKLYNLSFILPGVDNNPEFYLTRKEINDDLIATLRPPQARNKGGGNGNNDLHRRRGTVHRRRIRIGHHSTRRRRACRRRRRTVTVARKRTYRK